MVKAAMAALAALYAAMNGTGKRAANDVTLTIKPFLARAFPAGQVGSVGLGRKRDLKLPAIAGVGGKRFLVGPKCPTPGVVDQNIEMTSFRERGVECLLNRTRIAQVEVDRIQSRHLRNALRGVARRAPHFITCHERARRVRWPDQFQNWHR